MREGNVFTGVCQSVHMGVVLPSLTVPLPLVALPPGTTKAGGTHPTGMLS